MEELTVVSKGTHRNFFINSSAIGGGKAAEEHICMPATEEEIAHILRHYEERGFPSCFGSIDYVHLVCWDKCPTAGAFSACKGKGSFPTLAFEVVCCSNTRKIMSIFFGTVNDKTIAMSD